MIKFPIIINLSNVRWKIKVLIYIEDFKGSILSNEKLWFQSNILTLYFFQWTPLFHTYIFITRLTEVQEDVKLIKLVMNG
jgi:hypothetical protein